MKLNSISSLGKTMFPVSLVLILMTTSCSSSDKPSIADVKLQVESILPNCKFEPLRIPNGVIQEPSSASWQAWLAPNEITKRKAVFELDADGQEDWNKPPSGWRYFNKEGDRYFACHSLGKRVSSVDSYEELNGKDLPSGGFCWAPNPDLLDENLRRLKACEERVEEISKSGFWVVIRETQDPSKLEKELISSAKTNLEYKYSINPVLVSGGIAVTLSGNFDEVNDATISNVDLVWNEIIDKSKLAPLSNLVSGYPKKFNLDSFPGRNSESGDRKDIAKGYSRVSSYKECKNELRTSELSYVIGDCGKLSFEILQADLQTGECNFLGYWKDAQGTRRIGVVTFCDVYDKGSFVEGNVYKVGVRINGVTSYRTRLGYENSVLSFTAVR